MPYNPGRLPDIIDINELRRYVEEELDKVSKEFNETIALDLRTVYREPEKPREGMIVSADGSLWNPNGYGKGAYEYISGVWRRLWGSGSPGGFSQTRMGYWTRDISAANAVVAYTGVGFRPGSIVFIANIPGTGMSSQGFSDSVGTEFSSFSVGVSPGIWTVSGGVAIYMYYDGTLVSCRECFELRCGWIFHKLDEGGCADWDDVLQCAVLPMSGAAAQVPLEVFEAMWPQISGELDLVPGVWAPWWTKEAIYNSVMTGRFQLWAGGHGGEVRMWLVTQVAYYPAGNVLQGILVFGTEIDEYLEVFHAALEKFAREQNCFRMELSGRPGWSRKIQRFGFKMTSVTLSADVNETRTQ